MSDFYHCRTIKARKAHQCQECGDQIEPGQPYKRESGVFGGDFFYSAHCLACAALIDFGWDSYPQIFDSDSGRTVGGLLSDYVNAEAVYFDDDDTCRIADDYAQTLEVDPAKNWPRVRAEARP